MDNNSSMRSSVKRPARKSGRLMMALATVQAFFGGGTGAGRGSKMWETAFRSNMGNGKHNGRTVGAFGGKGRAKRHRALYLTPVD